MIPSLPNSNFNGMTPGKMGKPAFMNPAPEDLEYVGEAEPAPTFDHELEADADAPPPEPGKPSAVESRRIIIAQMNAQGYKNTEIARHLGYTPVGVGTVLRHPATQPHILRERERLVDKDAVEILKRTSVFAARRLER